MTPPLSANLGAKARLLKLLLVPGVAFPFSFLMRGRATIIMFHRFAVPDLGVSGHEPDEVRAALAYLRKHRYKLMPLQDLVLALRDGRVEDKSVAFTIDDGYFDHGAVAAPVFAGFDCPVTTFVASGFIDGALWYWWDQIEYVLTHTRRTSIRVRVGASERTLFRRSESERLSAHLAFEAFCKTVPDLEKHQWIKALAESAEIAVPVAPPPAYAPMTWQEIRVCEHSGMTFGPHSVTHPILARASDEQSRAELADSWQRLRACTARPCPVFCYPNGQPGDFGVREIETLAALGLCGAVVGFTGFPGSRFASAEPAAIFKVPRVGFAGPIENLVQDVSGVERLKQILRGSA